MNNGHYVAQQVHDLISTNDTGHNRAEQNAKLVKTYVGADAATRSVLNDVFITLCGYSLDTLVERYVRQEELYLEYDEYFTKCESANKTPLSYGDWEDYTGLV